MDVCCLVCVGWTRVAVTKERMEKGSYYLRLNPRARPCGALSGAASSVKCVDEGLSSYSARDS